MSKVHEKFFYKLQADHPSDIIITAEYYIQATVDYDGDPKLNIWGKEVFNNHIDHELTIGYPPHIIDAYNKLKSLEKDIDEEAFDAAFETFVDALIECDGEEYDGGYCEYSDFLLAISEDE